MKYIILFLGISTLVLGGLLFAFAIAPTPEYHLGPIHEVAVEGVQSVALTKPSVERPKARTETKPTIPKPPVVGKTEPVVAHAPVEKPVVVRKPTVLHPEVYVEPTSQAEISFTKSGEATTVTITGTVDDVQFRLVSPSGSIPMTVTSQPLTGNKIIRQAVLTPGQYEYFLDTRIGTTTVHIHKPVEL